MSDYPVQVDVTSPARFDRIQLLLRLGILIVLAIGEITTGAIVGLLFIALPIIAAVAISSEGRERYLDDLGPKLWRVLAWLVSFWAYMALLVDRFPSTTSGAVTPMIRFTGDPTPGSALSRLLTSIPSGLVLLVLWCVSWLLSVVATITVLFTASVPRAILAFQRGIVRWNARLVAYHASLVVEYPPWALDTDASFSRELPAAA